MRKRYVSDDELNQIIKLKQAGASWLMIQNQTGVPRRSARNAYEDWQRSQSIDELKAARVGIAAEEFRKHVDLLIIVAETLAGGLEVPATPKMTINADELLYSLWEKSYRGIKNYQPDKTIETRERQRFIREYQMLLKSLQYHTQEKVHWEVLKDWKQAWNSSISHLKRLEKEANSIAENIIKTDASLFETINSKSGQDKVEGRLAQTVLNVIWQNIVDGTLNTENPEIYSRDTVRFEILRQFGDEGFAGEFFSVFQFRVDRPELDVLNDSISRRFFALGGTREGWLSLKEQLRLWVRERYEPPPDGAITVTIVRSAANWHRLTSLPENFEVPNDYVLPSQSFHENFFRAVVQRVRGCQVLTAPPALGKSTYLSYLVGQLQEEKVPVIRHHYFLMVGDRTYGRLDHSRIAESLMNDILTLYPEVLGTFGARNPNPEELGDWLTAVGAHFVAQGKLLVVVIDGLDHVWRERDSREELVQLFEHLLPAPVGVVIVVGTQPVDYNQLPPSLLRECPRAQWVQLESFNRDAVAAWLEKHEKELDLPSNDDAKQNVLSQLAAAFHAKTDGHPLHLRFVLGYLLDRGQGVSTPAITDVPGTPSKDIMDYYSALWRSIPEQGRDILHLLACTKFPWTNSGVMEALDPSGTDITVVNSAFRQIQHLLTPTPLGFRPFHSSLFNFVRSQESHLTYVGPMRAKARQWLANKAPDYWRWAYSWLLDADDGQTDSLVDGPSRVWLIDSLSRGYPRDQIAEILGRSALAALEKGQLGRYVELALLKDYLNWQEPPALLGIQLSLGRDDRLRDISLADSESLVRSDLLALALFEARQGNFAAVEKCFTTLNHQVPREDGTDAILEWARSLVTMAAMTPNIELDRSVRFMQQFRTQGRSSYVLDALACSLRREKNMSGLRELLHFSAFLPDEQTVIRKHAVGLAFESGIDVGISDMQEWDDPFSCLYRCLRSKQDAVPLAYWPAWSMLERPENTFLSRRPSIANFFKMAYYAFVTGNLLEKTNLIDDWISQAPTPYVGDLLNRTNRLAAETATAARNNISMSFSNPYRYFEDAQRPRHWGSDREASEIADGMQAALVEIAFDLIYLQQEWTTLGTVSIDDMQAIFSSPFSDRWDWLASYVRFNSPFLPEPVLNWLINELECSIDRTIDIFSNRAESYSKLALISVMHTSLGKLLSR